MGLSDDLKQVRTELTDDEAEELLELVEEFDEDLRDALDMTHQDLQNGYLSLGAVVAMDEATTDFKEYTDRAREIMKKRVDE